jgi:hypothetical protein
MRKADSEPAHSVVCLVSKRYAVTRFRTAAIPIVAKTTRSHATNMETDAFTGRRSK